MLRNSLTSKWKVASLSYENVTDLFTYYTQMYATYYCTSKSTNILDETGRTKKILGEKLYSIPHLSGVNQN
jgi:hypothetical protein